MKPTDELLLIFKADAEEAFAFLTAEYGFQFADAQIHPPDEWITWRSGRVDVTAYFEWGSGFSLVLTLHKRLGGGIVTRNGFHQLLKLIAPDIVLPNAAIADYDRTRVRTLMNEYAAALRDHGSRLLKGEFP